MPGGSQSFAYWRGRSPLKVSLHLTDCRDSDGGERKPEGWSHFPICFLEVGLHQCACSDGLRVVPSAQAVTMLLQLLVVNPRLPGPVWIPTRQRPTGTTKGWHSMEQMGVDRRVETVLLRQRRHWHAGC